MYVCICNAVTDRAIREAAESGAHSFAEVRRRTGCSGSCGTCSDLAQQILEDTHRRRVLDLPLIAIAAYRSVAGMIVRARANACDFRYRAFAQPRL